MSDYSINADKKRGKRLEKSLEKLMPDKSWRARSQLLQLPDSTVIGWRNGREIPCSGLARLFQVGCDIVYILTGEEDPEHVITHENVFRWMEPGEETAPINPARNAGGIMVEPGPLDGINDEKGDMSDTVLVDALNDHIETLKRHNAKLEDKVESLESEAASLREENKHLLTLSSAKATRQAGSA